MSQSLRPYLQCVRSSLTAALSLSNFASQASERHNVPEIEAASSPEVLLNPLTVARNDHEKVFIEPSINSVRISIKIKQADEIEHILVHKFTRFLTQRAEAFFILRRKPIKGYDISFLITNYHTEEMLKHKLVDFIIQFMEEVDKEISEMKLFLNARARFVAESFLTPRFCFAPTPVSPTWATRVHFNVETIANKMQNDRFPEDRYAAFDRQNAFNNGVMPYAGAGGNGQNAPMNRYSGSHMAGQAYQQQTGNMNGPQMPFNNHQNQQRFTYGPSHMATYANPNANFNANFNANSNANSNANFNANSNANFNADFNANDSFGNGYGGNRRQSFTTGMQLIIPDIGLPPLAIKVFAQRDKDGHAVHPMFLTEMNPDAGIVNITGNPFNIKTNEIMVSLGQDAVVQDYPKSSGIYAIHIIQDRMSGKTDDIYVELKDWNETEKIMRRYDGQNYRDRIPKLGNRRVNMALSTASALMKAIFPRAKCLWLNGKPERPENWLVDHPSNWDGFVTREEMVKVLMFTEQTNSAKTRFSLESPERVYQTMISTMQKIPWDADRFFFPKEWVVELHALLSRMAVRLAQQVVERSHINLDTKLLEQFMKVMHSSPMYGNGDPRALENYMSIATKVDDIVSVAPGVAAPPRRRSTLVVNNGGHRSESRARDESLKEGLRVMHIVDRQNRDRSPVRQERDRSSVRQERDRSSVRQERDRSPVRQERDRSPVRQERNRSPVRRDYSPERRDQPPVRRDHSPVRREQSPVRREQAMVVRDHSPVRRSRNESPVRRQQSPVRREQAVVVRDHSPVRRSRNESPVRRQQSPVPRDWSEYSPSAVRRDESQVRYQRQASPARDYTPARREYEYTPAPRDYSPARRGYSPAQRAYSPVLSEESAGGVPVRNRSPARRADDHSSEHSSHASNRATTSGSANLSSGRRSTVAFSEPSTGRSGRRYDD
ncbi:hypothetical protein EG328_009693 [Venturia inaequalis]|uniref:Arp2/3 complex 20 kDa n=1 Tax=Venturia inaequalis TaxID=5025 RepID=A0A8H3VIG0_VENIN|nr:hypothetical protein EG328_009693 [Venturia inaequalis]